MTPGETVRSFWSEVWTGGDLGRIDDLVAEDFVIHSAGTDIGPRPAFRDWIAAFRARIEGLDFHVDDLIEAGSIVTTRWTITGRNRGFMGTPEDGRPLTLTGITITRLGEDGRIAEKWVERSAWETHRSLAQPAAPSPPAVG